MKKTIIGLLIFIVCAGTIFLICTNRKEKYIDKEMKKLIENYYISEYEEVENIKDINLGYTPYYSTLLDVKKCKQLETLCLGSTWHYFGTNYDIPQAETSERIKKIQSELNEILDECKNIECLHIYNSENVLSLDDLSFLHNRAGLCNLRLENMGNIDYSYVFTCSNLEQLH